jgi:hypothetical protein
MNYCQKKSRSIKGSKKRSHNRTYCGRTSDRELDSADCMIGKSNQCVIKSRGNKSHYELELERAQSRSRRRSAKLTGKLKGVSKCVLHDTAQRCNSDQLCEWRNGKINKYCASKYGMAKNNMIVPNSYKSPKRITTPREWTPPVREPTPKIPTPVREPTPKVKTPTPVREKTPVREPTPKIPTPVREKTPVREPTPKVKTPLREKTPVREPTPKVKTPVREKTPITNMESDSDDEELCDPSSSCCKIKVEKDCKSRDDCLWRNASIDKETGKIKVDAYCRNKFNKSKKEPEKCDVKDKKCCGKQESDCKSLKECKWVTRKDGSSYCRTTENKKQEPKLISECAQLKEQLKCVANQDCNWIPEKVNKNGTKTSAYCRSKKSKK